MFLDEIVVAKTAFNPPLRIFNTQIGEVRKRKIPWKAGKRSLEGIKEEMLNVKQCGVEKSFAMFAPANKTFFLCFRLIERYHISLHIAPELHKAQRKKKLTLLIFLLLIRDIYFYFFHFRKLSVHVHFRTF